jgi:2'-5' RNA ligase
VRLFVAVTPPDSVLDLIASLPRPAHPNVRWTTRGQWHVTLRFLGEVDDPERVVDALEAASLAGPRDVGLGPTVVALGRHVVCVPVSGVDELAAGVVDATRDIGRPPDDRPYAGHLTLARIKQGSARQLAGAAIEATWHATSLVLMHSHLHPKGARYEALHERRLAP